MYTLTTNTTYITLWRQRVAVGSKYRTLEVVTVRGAYREFTSLRISPFCSLPLPVLSSLFDQTLWRERRGGEEDDLIEPDTIINLSDPGLERFYKKKRPPKKIIIIVNGRRKSVEPQGLCFEDLIALAFETPPEGEQICFTITYRKGPADMPEGSLIEDQCVSIIAGMVFNVTATDKS